MNIFLILKLINWKIYMNDIIDLNKVSLIPDLEYYIKEVIKENKNNKYISYNINNIINLFLYILKRGNNFDQSINIVLSRIKDDYRNYCIIKKELEDDFFPIKNLIIGMLVDLHGQLINTKYFNLIFSSESKKHLLITKWCDDYTFVLELLSLFGFDENVIVNNNLVHIKSDY